MSEQTWPIAETFYSIQGEGTWTGTPMFFVRLAGCNVGRYPNGSTAPPSTDFQLLHPEHSTCTSHSGEEFICDTDYRVKERLTLTELSVLFHSTGAHHINFTGGEPFIHKDLQQLIDYFSHRSAQVHIETSGTIQIPDGIAAFITCSPKKGFLPGNVELIDQFKFLVRGPADEEAIHHFLHDNLVPKGVEVYVQPIEELGEAIRTINPFKFATECVLRNPTWKLSIQVHKVLGVR